MFTSTHLVINQQRVNYYHASWHYQATFCFILFSLQSGARTDVVRARSDTNPGILPQLPPVFLLISGLSGSSFYQLFICTWKLCNIHFHAASFYTWKRWRQDLSCVLINMHTICMQIMPLEIATISITSAYYLLRCNSIRHPAGVWHPRSERQHLFFLHLHILLSCAFL